jgi:hypothetical protein
VWPWTDHQGRPSPAVAVKITARFVKALLGESLFEVILVVNMERTENFMVFLQERESKVESNPDINYYEYPR